MFLLRALAIAETLRPGLAVLVLGFFLAWPLDWLRAALNAVPAVAPLVKESKFLAEVWLFALLLLGRLARR